MQKLASKVPDIEPSVGAAGSHTVITFAKRDRLYTSVVLTSEGGSVDIAYPGAQNRDVKSVGIWVCTRKEINAIARPTTQRYAYTLYCGDDGSGCM